MDKLYLEHSATTEVRTDRECSAVFKADTIMRIAHDGSCNGTEQDRLDRIYKISLELYEALHTQPHPWHEK